MPFSGNTYTPPTGAENAAPGQVIQSAVWDAIFTDIASALTTLMTQLNTIPTFANIMMSNGSFNVWQRGTSIPVGASTTQYTADRWYLATGANQACGVNATNSLDASAAPLHAVKIQRNNGQTGTGAIVFGFPFTADELINIRSGKVSLSGLVQAGVNWSPTNGTLAINLYVGTGTAGKRGGGFTNETNPLSISVNVAPSGSATITGTTANPVAGTSTQGELQVSWTPTGTAGADDSILLDAFCLVPGAIVQAFEDLPFDVCLRQCKRFYRKSFPYGVTPAQNAGQGGALVAVSAAASQLGVFVQHEPVEMYATASWTTYHPTGASSNWSDLTSAVSVAAAVDSTAISGKGAFIITNNSVSAANHVLEIHYAADASL
jgi:hypothetical protein